MGRLPLGDGQISGSVMRRICDGYCRYETEQGQNYCIVDGGIHHLNYYGQSMAMKIPFFEHLRGQKDGQEQLYNICGSLCTVGDVLVKQLPAYGSRSGRLAGVSAHGSIFRDGGHSSVFSRDLPKVFLFRSSME